MQSRFPELAPVAIQQGDYAARLITHRLSRATTTRPFQYIDKGNLATVGRGKAVADLASSGSAAYRPG